MNENPELYSKYCEMQKFFANELMDNYFHFTKLQKNNAKILDVGCGEGSVSLEVLLPKLPKNFTKFILSDISDEMVNFAKTKIKDQRIDAIQLDISNTTIPEELTQYFDVIFSFFCLNCIAIEKQLQSIKNIYAMLSPGGNIFLVVIINSPLYNLYKSLKESEKWRSYLGHFNISPYGYFQDPETNLRDYLETSGFIVDECKFQKCTYSHSCLDEFLGFALSIIPVDEEIPKNEKDEFIVDMKEAIEKCSLLAFDGNNEENGKILTTLEVLVCSATKST